MDEMKNRWTGLTKGFMEKKDEAERVIFEERPHRNWGGIAALVVGTLFIVLAGAMFATTNWHLIPDLAKFLIVAGLMVGFFAASFAAEFIFDIHRTGNACYLLGCIFTGLAVFTGGYYELFGHWFSVDGPGCAWLFTTAAALETAALFLGLTRFKNRFYTWISCMSLSTAVFSLMIALDLNEMQVVWGQMVYLLLLAAFEIPLRAFQNGIEDEGMLTVVRTLRHYFMVHFWFVSQFLLLYLDLDGEDYWKELWLVIMGGYALYCATFSRYRRIFGSLAMATFLYAFEAQPFFEWPEVLSAELQILPIAVCIYWLGFIWGRNDDRNRRNISDLQNIGYIVCLIALGMNVIFDGVLINALIMEAICLAIFLLAHVKGSRFWVYTSAIFMAGIAVHMTWDFWKLIGWWFYLLAAGLGLILFAALHERRHRGDEM